MNSDSIIETVKQHPKLIVADDFEITVKTALSRSTRWLDDVPTDESSDQRAQVCLRIMHRRRPGLSTTTRLTTGALSQLVEEAFHAAETSREDPWFRFPLWRKDETISQAPGGWQLRKSAALDHPPGCLEESATERQGETLIFRKTEKTIRRATTHWQKVNFQLPVRIGDSMVVLRDEIAGTNVSDQVFERKKKLFTLGDALLAGTEILEKITGPAIFSPHAMAAILKPVSKWFCADLFQAGASPLVALKRQTGWQPLFAECINLSDDASLPWGESREPFDAEGSLCSKSVLVERGTPNALLYDSYHSAKDNRLSTANSWTLDGETFPRITPTAFYLEEGIENIDAVRQKVVSGITVEHLDGFEMQSPTRWTARLIGRRFSGGVPAKAFATDKVSVDTVELLRQAATVGNDALFVGGISSPSIFFQNLP